MADQISRFREILDLYLKHGWRLERVLMHPETRVQLQHQDGAHYEKAPVKESSFDALWFSRSSHAGREAWEIRLVADTPYALFETFEADETEEYREDVRDDMEARLCFFSSTNSPA
jgi:hypothetical protein